MYNICKKITLNGNYDKEDISKKLDIFLLKNKLTLEEYQELISIIK